MCSSVRGERVWSSTEAKHSLIKREADTGSPSSNTPRKFGVRCSAIADASTLDTEPVGPYSSEFGGETDNDTIIAIATNIAASGWRG